MEFVADLLYDLPKNYGLVFDIVHYIVCLQGERLDMGDKFNDITKSHPLVSSLNSLFRKAGLKGSLHAGFLAILFTGLLCRWVLGESSVR